MLPISINKPTMAKIGMTTGPTESATRSPLAMVKRPRAHSSGQYDGDGMWMMGGMALIWVLAVAALVLAIAALVKYLRT